MLPKIIFKYSHIYNQNWQTWLKVDNKISQKISHKKVKNYAIKMERLWEKQGKAILRELSIITNLKWREKEIICYIVSDCRPFSDPLTLPAYKDKDLFVDVLTHELVHQLFSQQDNYQKASKAWGYFNKKYKNESHLTKVHIPLNAILWHIYKKIFNDKRLGRDISRSSFRHDYKKAWEIGEEYGYKNIIKEFSSRVI